MYRRVTTQSESSESQEDSKQDQGKEAMMVQQASQYEKMLNACLIERLAEEPNFA